MIFKNYRRETEALIERARSAASRQGIVGVETASDFLRRYGAPASMIPALADALARAVAESAELPEYDLAGDLSGVRGMTIRRELQTVIDRIERAHSPEHLLEAFARAAASFCPPQTPDSDDAFLTAAMPLVEHVADVPSAIETLLDPLRDRRAAMAVPDLTDRLFHNLCEASHIPYEDRGTTRRPFIPPTKYKGSARECVSAYLGGTPLAEVFEASVPLVVPERLRSEHTWVVGSSGVGKTTALKHMILRDMFRASYDKQSLIVIDSQRDLIQLIRSLMEFADGEPLANRLVYLDATDIEFPLALNIFSLGMQRFDGYDAIQKEQMVNTAIELYSYLLDSLLGSELTAKQGTLFRYVIRLMMTVPDATIHTLVDLFKPNSKEKFAAHVVKLPRTQREFFETEFWGREFSQTRSQVLRRLWTILENTTLTRMFSAPRSKLDMFAEMNRPNVILVNADKSVLRDSGTEIFGRFIIALIAMAVQERATLRQSEKLFCSIYIDECADYFSGNDTHITNLLEQSRKQNVGLILAHQYLSQLPSKTIDSISANTAIKLANTDYSKDAAALGRELRCSSETIMSQQRFSFAMHARNLPSATSVSFPVGMMESLERMSERRSQAIQAMNRQKFCTHYSEVEEAAEPADVIDLDDIPIDAEPR